MARKSYVSKAFVPDRSKFLDPFAERDLNKYYQSVLAWHGYIRFLGLPHLEDNPDENIDKLFVPQRLSQSHIPPDLPQKDWPKTERLLDVMAKHPRLVLLGDPGSGKSTIVNWLCWRFARWDEGDRDEWLRQLGELVPIPMVLRELDLTPDLTWDGLCTAFLAHAVAREWMSEGRLKGLLDTGQALVLLDGLDEVGSVPIREALKRAVFEGIDQCPNSRFFITSRIVGYEEVYLRRSIWQIEIGSELRWGDVQIDGQLRKAQGTIKMDEDLDTFYVAPFTDNDITRFARLWFNVRKPINRVDDQTPEKFLQAIRSDPSTLTLSRIPNLLTLMALIYRVYLDLPNGRALLYDKIAEAYLESIDKARGFKPKFTRDRMTRWLSLIGFRMQERRAATYDKNVKEILVDQQDVIRWLTGANCFRDVPTENEVKEFLNYIGRRSGLLLPRGEGLFAFMHLSFQEYFAAVFLRDQICSPAWVLDKGITGTTKSDLFKYAGSAKWTGTLLLLFELIGQRPSWYSVLFTSIFGEDLNLPDDDFSRAALLTQLAVDPHSGLSDSERKPAFDRIVRWELKHQENANWLTNCFLKRESLFIHFLAPTGYKLSERWKAIYDVVSGDSTLRNLQLFECDGLTDLAPLSRLTTLKSIGLFNCPGVADLFPLSQISKMTGLYLMRCPEVSNLTPINKLTELVTLSISVCSGVNDVSPLSGLSKLIRLLLLDCPGVVDLSQLRGLTHVEALIVLDCANVTNLPLLAEFSKLERLMVIYCPKMTDLSALKNSHSQLISIDLSLCTGVTDLSPLSKLSQLTSLNLIGCTGVTDLSPLIMLPQLAKLDLTGCTGINVPESLRREGLEIIGP